MLFDVVHLDSRPVTGLPYAERRGLLEGFGLVGAAWSTPAAIVGHGAQASWLAVRAAEGLRLGRRRGRHPG
ncbi:ATP-dependent DNA ligase, partial [Streptomyces anulatus]